MFVGAPPAKRFSAYTTEDSDGQTMLKDHAYKAVTDGFVAAHVAINTAEKILGWVGLTDDPKAGDEIASQEADADDSHKYVSFDVAKDEYFEIVATSGAPFIRWKSVGNLAKPIDQD